VRGRRGGARGALLSVRAALVGPPAGWVVVAGEDLPRLPPPQRARWRRRRVGIILQRDNLHPLLDVADNIALPLRLVGQSRGEIQARVGQLLEQIGLQGRRRHRIHELSGGEAQRVALAVALGPRPQVLLADEPTGELDEATADAVLDLLTALRAEERAAILTVTHNPRVAERADRRLTMRDGMLTDGA